MGLGLQGAVLFLGACGGADVEGSGRKWRGSCSPHQSQKAERQTWARGKPRPSQIPSVAYFFTDASPNGPSDCELIERLVY